MTADTVNENRGIYLGASVVRLDDKSRPVWVAMQFTNTPDAWDFLDDIYAAGTRAKFVVYESWSRRYD